MNHFLSSWSSSYQDLAMNFSSCCCVSWPGIWWMIRITSRDKLALHSMRPVALNPSLLCLWTATAMILDSHSFCCSLIQILRETSDRNSNSSKRRQKKEARVQNLSSQHVRHHHQGLITFPFLRFL